ncbi:hypothetical protein TNCV_2003351 [Trichonephila clavipes]|nr:hypothetical protein TNCV_2003351 [Trichonephila clavipes]
MRWMLSTFQKGTEDWRPTTEDVQCATEINLREIKDPNWLEIYANLQSPKIPKSISDKVPYRSVTISSSTRPRFVGIND